MTLKKNIFLFFVILMTSVYSFAQSEQELKVKADDLFKRNEFVEATSLYLRLLSLQPKSYEYSFKYGACLLYNSSNKQDAIRYLTYAVKSEPPIIESHYYLAKAYHLNYQFNEAIKEYKNYISKAPKGEFVAASNRAIVMCENGKNLLSNITEIIVRKKTEIKQADFFRLYDLTEIGGSIIYAVDFQSKVDKKMNHKPIVHLSPTMENVYFSSYGDGDNLDVFVARRLPGGKFGVPQRIPGAVNTPFDEDYPYMHPNGKELYFSSKGHNSMGGYDVFRAKYNPDENQFFDVENVDFSISSPDDDILYVVDKNNKNAYFSSTRQSQDGKVVVYKVGVERIPIQLAIIKGNFQSNALTSQPKMSVEVIDKRNGKRIGVFNSSKENTYLITFPKGGKYEYKVKIDGASELFTAEVEIPFLKELKPLKQLMVHEQIGDKERIRIVNRFDEEVEDAQSIVAQVLKERSNMNVNEDLFEASTDNTAIQAALNEIKLSNVNASQFNEILASKIESSKELLQPGKSMEEKAEGVSAQLYKEIIKIDAEIKSLATEADLTDSKRRKEIILANAKDLAQTREDKLQKIETIREAALNFSTKNVHISANDVEALNQIKETIQKATEEKNSEKIVSVIRENKNLLAQLFNQEAQSNTDKLLLDQVKTDNELKKLQATEQLYKDEITKKSTEINQLKQELTTTKEKNKPALLDKINDKEHEQKEYEGNLSKTQQLIQQASQKRNELTATISIVNEIESYQGVCLPKEEVQQLKTTVEQSKTKTLIAYINNSIEELSKQPEVSVSAKINDTIMEDYNHESEKIYNNSELSSYEKSRELVAIIRAKKQELEQLIENVQQTNEDKENKRSQLQELNKQLKELTDDQLNLEQNLKQEAKKEIAKITTENIIQSIDPTYVSSIERTKNENVPITKRLENENLLHEAFSEKLNAIIAEIKNDKQLTIDPVKQAKVDLLEKQTVSIASTIDKNKQKIKEEEQSIAKQEKEKQEAIAKQQAELVAKQEKEKQEAIAKQQAELAAKQEKEKQEASISIETVRNELEKSYNGNLSNDLQLLPENVINIQSLSKKLSQHLLLIKEKEQTIDENPTLSLQEKASLKNELNKDAQRIENRLTILEALESEKQQELLAKATSQQNNFNSEEQKLKTQQEVYQTFVETHNLIALNTLFNQHSDIIADIQQNIVALNNHQATIKEALMNLETSSYSLNEKQYISEQLQDELAKTDEEIVRLSGIENQLKRNEQIAINTQQNSSQPEANSPDNSYVKTKEQVLIEQLANENLSKKERQHLTKELEKETNQSLHQSLTAYVAQSKKLDQITDNLNAEKTTNNTVSKVHLMQINQLEKQLNKTNKLTKQAYLAKQLIDEKEAYITDIEQQIRVQEEENWLNEHPEIRLYSEKQLQQRRRQAIIEIEGLFLEKNNYQQALTSKNKHEIATIEGKITLIEERKKVLEKEVQLIDEQLANYLPIEAPTALAQNKISISYNEERTIASSEAYEKYAKVVAQQLEAINKHQQINNELIKEQQKLAELRKNEASEEDIEQQLFSISKISLNLSENEKLINQLNQEATSYLPSNTEEMMKFQNLVMRGVNPLKKVLIATALVPLSTNGIEFATAASETSVLKAKPVGVELPKGLVYRVQVGAFAKPIPENHFSEFTPVTGEKLENSNITRYMAGYFSKANNVVEARDKIKQLGYTDAFIVAYCDGKRIHFGEARKLEQNGECLGQEAEELQLAVAENIANKLGLKDTVKTLRPVSEYSYNQQVGAAKSIALEQFDAEMVFFTVQVGVFNTPVKKERLLNLEPLYTMRLENGQIRYSVGMYGNLQDAKKLEGTIRSKGITDAFVTAYYQGKRINIEKALMLINEGKAKVYSEQISGNEPSHELPVEEKTEIIPVFKTAVKEVQSNEQYVQFISKQSYEYYPKEQLNRYRVKGNFFYDINDLHIKSDYYSTEELLPRISGFKDELDTLFYSKSDVLKSNDSRVTFEIDQTTIPGDLYDYLVNLPYRKKIQKVENGIEIHIFDIKLEDIQQLRAISERLEYPIKETQNTNEYERISK